MTGGTAHQQPGEGPGGGRVLPLSAVGRIPGGLGWGPPILYHPSGHRHPHASSAVSLGRDVQRWAERVWSCVPSGHLQGAGTSSEQVPGHSGMHKCHPPCHNSRGGRGVGTGSCCLQAPRRGLVRALPPYVRPGTETGVSLRKRRGGRAVINRPG